MVLHRLAVFSQCRVPVSPSSLSAAFMSHSIPGSARSICFMQHKDGNSESGTSVSAGSPRRSRARINGSNTGKRVENDQSRLLHPFRPVFDVSSAAFVEPGPFRRQR